MEELDDARIDALEARLRRMLSESTELVASTRDGAKPVDLDEPIGRLTRMDAMQQQATLQAERRAHDLRRRQVEQALRRIEDGSYGSCLKCGEPVGTARLEARPESPFCLDCQDRIDKKLSG